ncbi:MAG: response regulator [Rhodospirillaceae bacterium]|nr:response regulator [Rhodospirillaceae bacterium]
MADQIVHLIDDDDGVREALTLLLTESGFTVRSYKSGVDFLAAPRAQEPGCIVSDIRMPGLDGLELQSSLRAAGSNAPIIFITGHGDVPMAVQALRAGALDFIEKPFDDDHLLASIKRALEASLRISVKDAARQDIEQRMATLTPREQEVLECLMAGRANKIIAFDLNMSMRTVEVHRARIMQKMKAGSLSELVRLVMSVKPEDDATPR